MEAPRANSTRGASETFKKNQLIKRENAGVYIKEKSVGKPISRKGEIESNVTTALTFVDSFCLGGKGDFSLHNRNI